MTPRQFAIHYARVMLAEAARRRKGKVNRDFYWLLIESAASSRKLASSITEAKQLELI